MIEMVTGLTKKILWHEINTNEDSVKQMILLAINSVIDKENMVIRIHPSDKAHAEAFYPELKNLFSEIKNITFEEHSGIEKGGCMIDTNFGTIDARIDQLEGQIDKILKLTPAVPVVSSSSKPLSEKSLETETKASDESTGSETPASETETKAGDESTGSETPASEAETKANEESTGSETPASEAETKASDESTGSETPASETETKASDESTGSETPASETETKANEESTGSETPASEKSPKDTPEKED
jgi:flagellar assembly protein FliH